MEEPEEQSDTWQTDSEQSEDTLKKENHETDTFRLDLFILFATGILKYHNSLILASWLINVWDFAHLSYLQKPYKVR